MVYYLHPTIILNRTSRPIEAALFHLALHCRTRPTMHDGPNVIMYQILGSLVTEPNEPFNYCSFTFSNSQCSLTSADDRVVSEPTWETKIQPWRTQHRRNGSSSRSRVPAYQPGDSRRNGDRESAQVEIYEPHYHCSFNQLRMTVTKY